MGERHEFEARRRTRRGRRSSLTAPGFGQPRPQRLGEARGLHVYEADADAIVVRTYGWSGGDWTLAAERRFPRAS